MSQKVGKNNNKVYRLVLTGGPCGGKTTGQVRLCTFFENLGWKVYRVPETATILLGGGVKWTDLSEEEVYTFQANLLRTMMQIEETFFELAANCDQNCLVICDRGAMDASAYMKDGEWERMCKENNWNSVELRDDRYNQVIHMVSAACGAEDFYNLGSNSVRKEGIELARQLDQLSSQAWVGHPYYDVIDNSTEFEAKVMRMIAAVCNRLGIDAEDRLNVNSKKRKFLVETVDEDLFTDLLGPQPQYQNFIVVHDYLVTPNSKMQARIRRRGQGVRWDSDKRCWDFDTGNWTYTHTIRRPKIKSERPELKMQISLREYELLVAQRDSSHYTVYKKRRCFLWNNQYFQMDIYQEPCHPKCKNLILLETYTTQEGDALKLPNFLKIQKEVTGNPEYSMYNLTKRDTPPAKPAIPKENGVLNSENGQHGKLNHINQSTS